MKLSNYRPVMTANYTLDWLTAFNLKAVHELREEERNQSLSLLETAEYVNKKMSQIMNGDSIVWGVKANGAEKLIGSFALKRINISKRSAQLSCSFFDSLTGQKALSEIVPHVLAMLAPDLQLQTIFVSSQNELELGKLLGSMSFESQGKAEKGGLFKFVKKAAKK